MTEKKTSAKDTEKESAETQATALTTEEREAVEKRKAPPAKVVHEVIRQQGIEELNRPVDSLLWSGVAGGVSIWLSLIAQGALMLMIPDSPWRPFLSSIGYSVGFVVVILGKLQLFTETTVTAVLPLATAPTWESLWRTLRLWIAVFFANMVGTFIVAVLIPHTALVTPDMLSAMLDISHHVSAMSAGDAFARGIPAGFILATIAWLLPNARGQEFWIIIMLTWIISLAGFSHVIAGSAEAWLLVTTGKMGFGAAIGGFILPALAGNILGGTGLFAVLAHAQVRSEL